MYAAARLNSKRIDRALTRANAASRRRLPYHLYIWKFHTAPSGVFFERQGRARGRCINSFARYSDLLTEVKTRCAMAGYPFASWMYLYDWSKGAR